MEVPDFPVDETAFTFTFPVFGVGIQVPERPQSIRPMMFETSSGDKAVAAFTDRDAAERYCASRPESTTIIGMRPEGFLSALEASKTIGVTLLAWDPPKSDGSFMTQPIDQVIAAIKNFIAGPNQGRIVPDER